MTILHTVHKDTKIKERFRRALTLYYRKESSNVSYLSIFYINTLWRFDHQGLARHLVSTNSIYSMVQFKILPLSLKALYQKTGRDVPPHCKRCFRRSRHRMGGMKIPMTVTVVVMGMEMEIIFTTTHGILLHLLFGI